MKRQLIAALLALNVAAVAVPSATFTVSAANVDETAVEAQEVTDGEWELSSYSVVILNQVKAYTGKDGSYAFAVGTARAKAREDVNTAADTKLKACTSKQEMDGVWDWARTEIDNLANDADISAVEQSIDDEVSAVVYFNDTKTGPVHENGKDGKEAYEKYVNTIVAELKTALAKETKKDDIKNYLADFKEKIKKAGLKDKATLQKEYKAKAKSYIPEDYTMNDYSVEQVEYIQGKLADAETAINAASAEEVVRAAYDDYKIAIGPNGWQLPKAIVALKADKKTALKNYLTGNTYTDVQQKAIDDIKAKYDKALNEAVRRDKINALYEEAVANINAVITKDQSEAALNDAMNKIKAIGKLDASNYKEKHGVIKAAREAYNKLEEGTVGKQKLDTDNVFKTDENASVVQSHYTYKDLLVNAENRYDNITVRALTETYKKLVNDLVTINADNYQDYKAEYDNAIEAAKTVFDKDKLTDTDYVNAKDDADDKYATAKQTILALAVREFGDLITGDLEHVIDGGVAVNEENKAIVEKAIKAYRIIAKFAETDHNLFGNVTNADKYYRQEVGSYNKLVELLDDYNKKLQIADDRINLEKATVVLAKDSVEYDGTQIDPGITVTNASGEALVRDKDYIVRYDDNVNVGKVTVTVVGIGEYKKSQNKTFDITPKDISKETAKAADMYYYNGSARNGAVTVTVAGKNIAKGTDYTVAYKNNKNIGKATAEITGKGNYTGTIKATYVIKPAKSPIKSLKAGKKKLTVKTAKQPGAKYQIAYKVKGGSYKTVKTSNVSKTIKSLKSGKTYAVKVRAYKSISGKTYYGRYSAVKTVKVK